jgi:hypothetical protein
VVLHRPVELAETYQDLGPSKNLQVRDTPSN